MSLSLQLRTPLALGQIIARVSNISRRGETVQRWCFKPSGYLVVVDVMLGQKISLENCEREALAVAIAERQDPCLVQTPEAE